MYLFRGVGGLPGLLLASNPHANDVKARMTFTVITSLVSSTIGACFALGVWMTPIRVEAGRSVALVECRSLSVGR